MDEWDALGHGMKIERRSSDWGILSLMIGVSFLIMSPIMLTFQVIFFASGMRLLTREEVQYSRIATVVVGGAFVALIVFGVFCALRAMGLAKATSQPLAIPLGALLICVVDLFLWIALAIVLLAILRVFQ